MECVNLTAQITNLTDDVRLESYYIPPMLIACIISLIVNIRVLICVYWIRRPLSPTLHISLSLAAADACTSALLGIGLLINSYLPLPMFDIQIPQMISIVVEMFRLSGILITVLHLLALSINHYLGILKPLHYLSIVTTRKTTIVIALLWFCPTLFIVSYFSIETDGFCDKIIINETNVCNETIQYEIDEINIDFMNKFKYRFIFSSLFFIPFFLMAFCYTHILVIVRRHQKDWSQLSRSGSTRWRAVKTSSKHSVNNQQKQMEGNIRAIYTTLLILGSFLIGWMPAVIIFLLMCKADCYISGSYLSNLNDSYPHSMLFIMWLKDMLIILKTFVNTLIYSSRMSEIQEGIRRMHLAVSRYCCTNHRDRYMSSDSALRYTGSFQVRITSLCRTNGNVSHKSISQYEMPNTLL